ncbi:MAG: fibronectin type III domain-containing protein [Lachnospiraceae bacterium]|nr:fibronectin type III domain-containing protein [Lachnospiraceae bacterium]
MRERKISWKHTIAASLTLAALFVAPLYGGKVKAADTPAANITKIDISVADIPDQTYTGKALTPDVTVTAKQDGKDVVLKTTGSTPDYTVEYSKNNINANDPGTEKANFTNSQLPAEVTITFKTKENTIYRYENQEYKGKDLVIRRTFKILPKDIGKADISKVADQTYTGEKITKGPKVIDKERNVTLKRGTGKDYRFGRFHSTNINAGTLQGTLYGINNYCGSVPVSYQIKPCPIYKVSISNPTNVCYNGKAKTRTMTLTYNNKSLVAGKDYNIFYEDNVGVGTAVIRIEGIGNFNSLAYRNFTIKPIPTRIKKLIRGKRKFRVVIAKRIKMTTGYQVQYSTRKSMSNSKKKILKKTKTKYTFKKLKRKKTYYVRVRTYKTVDGIRYYSKWSPIRSIKTK